MNLVLCALIVAVTPTAAMDVRYPDAVEIFHCRFDESWDQNLDEWPDGWMRRRGEGFPKYLPIAIVDDPAAPGQRCLRVNLDGGAATLYSPDIPVGSRFSYILEGRLKTEALVHDRAFISVTFYDEKSSPLQTVYSERIREARDWRHLRIGPMVPDNSHVHHAVIALHLEPTDGQDLKGAAMFDDLWFARLPRMTLTTNSSTNVYAEGSQPEITCQVSGFLTQDPVVLCEVEDVSGAILRRAECPLTAEATSSTKAAQNQTSSADSSGFTGSAKWSPPLRDPGFYRVRFKMKADGNALMHERVVSLVVIRPQNRPLTGEFGWTLPRGDDPLPMGPLAQLVNQAGVHWVKFPLWYGSQELNRAERLVWFSERLNFQGIELVGLLLEPPAEVRQQFGERASFTAADVFSTEDQLWYPALEPVLTRLSLKVRWWQLGQDQDTSFVGYPNLPEKIAQIKKQFQRFGQQVYVGIGWRWMNEPPPLSQPPWSFLSLSANPSLSAEEMAAHLATNDIKSGKRWVVTEPLPRDDYDLPTRAADLVERMVTAKRLKADAIFVSDPFHPQRGLMNTDGTPGELFLPWRTTALLLAGSEYLGSVTLPQGSHNHVFARGGETVMVVWNDKTTQEPMYTNDNVREVDVWGRVKTPSQEGDRLLVDVGPLPTFVTGLSEPVSRWQIGLSFASTQVPNVAGKEFFNSIGVKNNFGQGVGGQIRLFTPEAWRTTPREVNFKLAPGETLAQPFSVGLPFDAVSGRQKVRVDFDVNADRRYQFSVYRELVVGSEDVVIEASSRLNEQGELEVEQHLVNNTEQPVSFKCQLFVPDRLRMLSAVLDQGHGRNTRTYRVANGEEIVGKTLLLRAEEIGGQRVLNIRFAAER
jgi:hypothetical protein